MSQQVSKNKVIEFTYSIIDDMGNVVEQVDSPFQYVHGASSMGLIETVEDALLGARVGEKVEVKVPPEDGFGEHDPSLTFVDDIDNVPPQFRSVGTKVEMKNEAGEVKEFAISKIEDDKVTIDGNHPLAGKTATFIVAILSVRDATADEIKNGVPHESVSVH